MNKYLIEILKIQSSVILPGLGALMMPSQKTGKIVFNPHLKFNDGSLAKFISEKEGVENQEAQNKVAKFVREIEAELSKGNSYDLFEFGKFIKNDKGAIDFIMDSKLSDAPISDTLVDKKKGTSTDKSEKEPEVKKKEDTTSLKKEDKVKEIEKKPKKLPKKKEETKKVDNKTSPVKKDLSVDKKTTETDSKQSKNKFVPPIEKPIEKIKDTTPIVDKEIIKKTATKITDKVKEVLPKNVEAKADNIKSEIKDKIISPIKTTEKSEKSKTDNPSIKSVASIIGATASGAAKSTKGIVSTTAEKTADIVKETVIVKETIKETVSIKEEKKKKSKLPWIILLLLLIGLSVAGYFFRAEIMAFFNKDGSQTENSITENSDHTDAEDKITNLDTETNEDITSLDNMDVNDTSKTDGMASDLILEANNDRTNEDTNEDLDEKKSEQIENAPPPPVINSGSNNGAYHLIGNSFGKESNANKYAKSMQEKGYPAKVLGRFDGLYMVSLKSYDSRSAAKEGRSSVTADASSAWVFKYSK